MNREPLNGNIIKTDDGQYIRYNAQMGCYELLEEIVVSQPQSNSQPADGADNACSTDEVQNVEEISYAGMLPKGRLWGLTTTLLLLDECTTHKQELFDPKMKNTAIYKKISKKMVEHGYNFTPEQIQNRMKTLISKYKEIKDHNAGSGNSFKDWEYYEVMENYMGKTPNITPVASCSSLGNNIIDAINAKYTVKGKNKHEKSCDTGKISCSSTTSLGSISMSNVTLNNNTQRSDTQKRAKRFRSSPRVEMLAFLKEYKEDIKRREVERMRMMQEQHQETKEMVSELISLIKDKEAKKHE